MGWVVGGVVAVVLAGFGLAVIGPTIPGLAGVAERYERLGTVLALLVDLGVVGVFAAFVVRRIRITMDRRLVGQST